MFAFAFEHEHLVCTHYVSFELFSCLWEKSLNSLNLDHNVQSQAQLTEYEQ